MEIRNVRLHFGQNSGKFSRTVSSRICVRVFPRQTGQLLLRIALKAAHRGLTHGVLHLFHAGKDREDRAGGSAERVAQLLRGECLDAFSETIVSAACTISSRVNFSFGGIDSLLKRKYLF